MLGMQVFVCIGALESEFSFLFCGTPVVPHFLACSLDDPVCSDELPIYDIEILVGGRRLQRNVVASIGKERREHRGWNLELNAAASEGRERH